MKIIYKLKIILFNYVAILEFKRKYQFAIKFFIYAIFETRSNIVYAMSIINRYVFNFIFIHEKIVKRIFRYIYKQFWICVLFFRVQYNYYLIISTSIELTIIILENLSRNTFLILKTMQSIDFLNDNQSWRYRRVKSNI